MSPGSPAFVYLGAEENLCRWYEHSGLGAGEPRKHGERQLFRPARSGPASPLPASFGQNLSTGTGARIFKNPTRRRSPAAYIPGPFAPGVGRVVSSETASILSFVAAASARKARRCSIVSRAWNASRNSATFCSIA